MPVSPENAKVDGTRGEGQRLNGNRVGGKKSGNGRKTATLNRNSI